MRECCVCHENRPYGHGFVCKQCQDKYGKDRSRWPEWLKFLVTSYEAEAKSDSRYNHRTVRNYDNY